MKNKTPAISGAMVVTVSTVLPTDVVAYGYEDPSDDIIVVAAPADVELSAEAREMIAPIEPDQIGIIDGDSYRIAQTYYGGGGDDTVVAVPIKEISNPRPLATPRQPVVLTHPVRRSSMFVMFDMITGLFYDAETEEELEAEDWMTEQALEQVEGASE